MGSYDASVGSLLLGVLFNTLLYGVAAYQFAVYYQTEFRDRPAIKYMVPFLFILDTFHSTSVVYMAWNYLVSNHNNPAALEVIGWPYAFTPVCTALTALTTQMFLGIWCLTRNKILYSATILLAIASFILGTICSAETWVIKAFSGLSSIVSLVIVWLSLQVVVDTIITIALTVVLSGSQTGLRKTDAVLHRLIRCAIQTGLFAGLFCMAGLITFVILPGTNFYGIFVIPTGRVYTNTVLYVLLVRKSFKAETVGPYGVTCPNTINLQIEPRFAAGRVRFDSPIDEHPTPQSARDSLGDV